MKLLLQVGYGMMEHCSELLRANVADGVILSPRDLTLKQLLNVALDANSCDRQVLFDPQCYVRDANHIRLVAHAYWKVFKQTTSANLFTTAGAASVIDALATYNTVLSTAALLLPGIMADPLSKDWLTLHRNFAAQGTRKVTDRQVFSTIALSTDVLADEAQIEAIVEHAKHWETAGFYVVVQADKYLVEDVTWLSNLLILTSGLRLLKKTVIVGYSNHQQLCLGAANVDAIASGTWLNVRSFDPDKFFNPEEDDVSRRARWYYCPQAFSEYKLTYLDAAKKKGILKDLRTSSGFSSRFADPLFAGADPTSVNWPEKSAFRHYLTCLNAQTLNARKASFDQTLQYHRDELTRAEHVIKHFRSHNVSGGDRDYKDLVDISRNALDLLDAARGTQLRRQW